MTDTAPRDLPRAFRYWYICEGEYLASPYADLAPFDPDADAVCNTHDHPAPFRDCTCGYHVAENPSSLLTIAQQVRDYPTIDGIVRRAVAAEERGEDYRIPVPCLAICSATDSLEQSPRSDLRNNRVIWAMAGRRQANDPGAWRPELGALRRCRRITLRELHISGDHDLSKSELEALSDRYGVPVTEHWHEATPGPKHFRLKIGGRSTPIPGDRRRPKTEYEILKSFVTPGDPIEARMRDFGLLP